MLGMYDDDTPTLPDIPVIRDEPRPCKVCRRKHRLLKAAGVLAAAVLFGSTAAYGVSFTSQHQNLPAVQAAEQEPHPWRAPREVMPPTMPATHKPVMRHRAVHHTHRAAPTYSPRPSASRSAPARAPAPRPTPKPTVTHHVPVSGALGARLLAEAETMKGVPYHFGGHSPSGFDCSGLIYWAAQRLGISLPRSTFAMLAGSPHLFNIIGHDNPRPGDLAFFGSGHVELYVSPGRYFGAQQSGTLVGFHTYGTVSGFVPTTYLRLR